MASLRFSPRPLAHHSAPQRFSFRQALVALKAGERIAREGWNGQSIVLMLIAGSRFGVHQSPMLGPFRCGTIGTGAVA
jgi:hypothetical protein